MSFISFILKVTHLSATLFDVMFEVGTDTRVSVQESSLSRSEEPSVSSPLLSYCCSFKSNAFYKVDMNDFECELFCVYVNPFCELLRAGVLGVCCYCACPLRGIKRVR